MPYNVKPIETIYNGYRFRSRLEARWAVFFDHLNIGYRYEPEGFDIDGTWYLPDFYLPDYHCWFEVKSPNITSDDLIKPLKFGATGRCIIVPCGDVWHGTAAVIFGFGIDCEGVYIVGCPVCDGIGILRMTCFECLKCPIDIETSTLQVRHTWHDAYLAARQARFGR